MNFTLILTVIILCAGVGLGFFAGRKIAAIAAKKSSIDVKSSVKRIMPAAEFASLVYHYSSVISHSDALKLFKSDISLPFTEKKAIYTIDGTIKLGFDGSKIGIESHYSNIVINMPKMKILSHEIHPETFSLYDEKTSLFNRYSLKDANSIQVAHKAGKEENVNHDTGLFVQARQSAQRMFGSLLENIPGIKDKYEIVFEWEK